MRIRCTNRRQIPRLLHKGKTMEDISIEHAQSEDVPVIMELLKFANMHYIPSEEMADLDWRYYFVAREGDRIVGASGYKILSETQGKTQLMVVHPDCRRRGIGHMLQVARLEAMAGKGVATVITNADRPETIEWYKKHFCYREIGSLKKVHEFGDPAVDSWTTLEMNIQEWMDKKRA